MSEPNLQPGITLAATPIGNSHDASDRLKAAIEQADIIGAEDTRRALSLINRLGLETHAKITSVYEHNESRRAGELIEAAKRGQRVLVFSDAGMPTVSDPGYNLVTASTDAGIPLTVIPGPSAVLTALALSGLPTDRFTFEGFLPRKPSQLAKALAKIEGEARTMIFFESPKRIHQTLEAMAIAFGPERPAALCRELTKTYEEVIRKPLGELVKATEGEVRGEICLVVQGSEDTQYDLVALVEQVNELRGDGLKTKAAVKHVAEATGASKKELYQAYLDRYAAN